MDIENEYSIYFIKHPPIAYNTSIVSKKILLLNIFKM